MNSTDSLSLMPKKTELMAGRTFFRPKPQAIKHVWGSLRALKAANTNTEASWPWTSPKLSNKISERVVESWTWAKCQAVSPSRTVSRST